GPRVARPARRAGRTRPPCPLPPPRGAFWSLHPVHLVPSRPAHPARAPHGLAAGPARPIRPCVRPTPLIILRHGRSRPRPPPFAPRSSRGPRGRPIMSVSSTIDDRVRAVAERQCGVVTREQLLNAGMSRGGLRHRLTIGRLRRLHPGVYLVGP